MCLSERCQYHNWRESQERTRTYSVRDFLFQYVIKCIVIHCYSNSAHWANMLLMIHNRKNHRFHLHCGWLLLCWLKLFQDVDDENVVIFLSWTLKEMWVQTLYGCVVYQIKLQYRGWPFLMMIKLADGIWIYGNYSSDIFITIFSIITLYYSPFCSSIGHWYVKYLE